MNALRTLVPLVLAAPALAGEPLPAIFVSDSSTDTVWRLQDFDFDGDYNDAGEVVAFYDDTLGTFPMTNNVTLELGEDGTLYVGDTTEDVIYALKDLDLDGTCNGAGESRIFFNGDPTMNAAGIQMGSIADLTFGPDGRLWGTNADNGAGGFDGVFWMEDTNGDGDANDAGEAFVFYQFVSGSTADSVPTGLTFGPDGAAYYVDAGSSGLLAKGVYRLDDADLSGSIDQPGEVAAFFIPATMANTPFYWDVELGADGAFYMADTGNELVWRFEDTNANDTIDVGTEDVLWWQGTASFIWQLQVGRGLEIFAAESQSPDSVVRYSDDDASGTIDQPGETVVVYDNSVSGTTISNPRGMLVDLSGGYGTTFCDASDAALASCPCANAGAPDTGCDTPIPAMQGGGTTGGVKLSVVAQTTNVQNRATLAGAGYPTASNPAAVVIRDIGLESFPIVFGDGLRCVGVTDLTRLAATVAGGGSSTHTFGHGAMAGSGTFYYQLWFRSTPTSYCDPALAFNLSNGQTLTW